MNEITKRSVKSALGITTDAELARLFVNPLTNRHINRWAVGQWGDDEPLPMQRQWQLRATRPELFSTGKRGQSKRNNAT